MEPYRSSRPPYVRKAMVVAHEAGIAEQMECLPIVVSAYRINDDILGHNPPGKIPTLIRDHGTTLFESHVICEYLDGLRQTPQARLFPVDEHLRFQALACQDGILELLLARLGEERTCPAGQRPDTLLQALKLKLTSALNALETQASALEAAGIKISKHGGLLTPA